MGRGAAWDINTVVHSLYPHDKRFPGQKPAHWLADGSQNRLLSVLLLICGIFRH